MDLQGVEPCSLDCKSKRRPVGKPISYVSDSCGIRTRPSWLERPATSPEVERAILVMYVRTSSAVILKVFLQATHSVDWEVLEPSSPALQASAIPSQLPVREQAVGIRL